MVSQSINGNLKNTIADIIPHIVQTACNYKSSITFVVDNKNVNAKSIMGVMALAGQDLSSINICAEGADELEALKAIAELLG